MGLNCCRSRLRQPSRYRAYPAALLTLDLLSGQSQQAPLPAPPVRKKARKRNRIAPPQVPGIAPAPQQNVSIGGWLPDLGIQTPEAALVVGDPKGQLRLELGKGAAVCQRLPEQARAAMGNSQRSQYRRKARHWAR